MKKPGLSCLFMCFWSVAAFASSHTYYYDTTGQCSNALWCSMNPGDTCCAENKTVDSLTQGVTKTGYSLRGFVTGSSTTTVSTNSSGLNNLIIDKDGDTVGAISGVTALSAAWAKNCATNITGGVCSLDVGADGSVSYTATSNSGYTCSSGCQTANPVFEESETPNVVPDDWITFTLNNSGGNGGQPTTFACQKNANADSGCAQGCYKSESNCNTNNRFTGLSTLPTRTNFRYSGHFSGTIQVLDDTGKLASTNWMNISGENVTITAQWTESNISINYGKGNCQSTASNNPSSCVVNNTFTLSDATPSSNQNFNVWLLNGVVISGSSITCDRATLGGGVGNAVTITAQCSEKPNESTEVTLSYVADCNGGAGCPTVSDSVTCIPGENVTLNPITGNSSWTFSRFCMGAVCGNSFICPSEDANIIVEFTAVNTGETNINITYDNGICSSNVIPSDVVTSCNVGEQFSLNLNPDPDGTSYPYWFSGWLVNNNLIHANYDGNSSFDVSCDRAILGGTSGEPVTITAKCVDNSMGYLGNCYGRDCPEIPSGTTNFPIGCATGESITIPQWTGDLPEGWYFKGWKIYQDSIGSVLFQPGDVWTCGEGDSDFIQVVFGVPIPWKTYYLNDTIADIQSSPRWLCRDQESKIYGTYNGGNGNSAVCDEDARITSISVPQSDHWEYGGHQCYATTLIKPNGEINNYVCNDPASAVWNPVVNNYTKLSYVADCNGGTGCPELSNSITCIHGDTVTLEPVAGNGSWKFDKFCINNQCETSFICPSQSTNVIAKFIQNTETTINIDYEKGNCPETVISETAGSCTVGQTFELLMNNATNHIGWMLNGRLINQWDVLCDRSVLGGTSGSSVTMTARCKDNNMVQINYKSDCVGYDECPGFSMNSSFDMSPPAYCNPGDVLTVPMAGGATPLPSGWVFMGWKVYNGLRDNAGIPYAPGRTFVCPQKTDSNNGNIWIERMFYIPDAN